jgi:predicted DNA-binding transcriptional regulator AlpA
MLAPAPEAPRPRRLYRARDIAAITTVSTDTIRRWTRTGRFPAPFRLAGRPVWDADAVDAHLANLAAEASHVE